MMSRLTKLVCVMFLGLFAFAGFAAQAQDVPKPGESARIDTIKKRGTLRVGIIANPPWLVENTSGSGEGWYGPAWTLTRKYADLLGVKLELVPVSQDTKIPVLAADKVDITIAPMTPTQERLKVVDFVSYSVTASCLFGLANNPKLQKIKSIDEVNDPNISIAFFTGAAEGPFLHRRFPDAQIRGVSTAGSVAPVEEVTAHRSDLAVIANLGWIELSKKVKGLIVFPRENNCQDSKESALPVGMAIDKGQTAFLNWLTAVATPMVPQLRAEERKIVEAK